jgi:membrane-associated phospholipid phosphatase
MFRTNARSRRHRLSLELLEARELLSGVPSPHGIKSGEAMTGTAIPITLHLATRTAPAGDYVAVASERVLLTGQAAPGARIVLRKTLASGKVRRVAQTRANAQGAYRFALNCGMGTTPFTAVVVGAGGGASSGVLSVTRANQAIVWNSIALQAVRTAGAQPPDASRDYAIVSLAVYDAVNAVDPKYAMYGGVTATASRRTSADAAACAAAETALAALFPGQTAMFEGELSATMAAIPAGGARDRGMALGTSVANQILAMRANDGANVKVNYVPLGKPNDPTTVQYWQPTPKAFAPAVDPQWGNETPFALKSVSQFQPPPPPSITSAQYAQELNQVEMLGGTTSTVRTADETAAALFWSDLAKTTFDPPGHWNQITEIAAMASKSNLLDSARALALVNIALADAGIVCWNVKFTDNTVRPVTVIRDGADGVNPGITADPTWTPLWNTPAFPSYISGHSTFSSAAAAVLTSIYGDHFAFTDSGDPTEHLAPRHFASFEAAAQEAGMSRIWGGIHFMSDNIYGLQVGGEIGQYVVKNELLAPQPAKR